MVCFKLDWRYIAARFMSWTMRRQFLFVEINFVKNRQLKFFFFNPPHPHSSSALFFDRTLSFGCLRALRWISEVCCVFLIYKSSIPRSLASSSFLQHFLSIIISSLSNPLPQLRIVYILQIFKFIVYFPPQCPPSQTWSSNRLPIYCTEISIFLALRVPLFLQSSTYL